MLILADAEHQRTAAAGADNQARKLGMHDCDAVGAGDLPERLADGGDKRPLGALGRAVKGAADKMGKHLGIGLGLELVAFRLHLGAEGGVVLDDTVVDEGQLAGAVEVGVGVLPGNLPMGGPTGVADAGGAADRVLLNGAAEFVDAADFLTDGNHPLLEGGDPGRVIATVFQAAESLQKDGDGLGTTDISDDSAHGMKRGG